MSGEAESVRPTKVCIGHLGLSVPAFDVSLADLDHPLIKEAQRTPAAYVAGGVERILSLTDRIWFKVKTGRWRGAATRLEEPDPATGKNSANLAPWWLGAAGYRRDGDPGDFYASLAAAAGRDGNSDRWLPSEWDWKRLEIEQAYAWVNAIQAAVRRLIILSLSTGRPYQAEFENYRVTALARAKDGETYLAIESENVADAKVFAVILNAVPGIVVDDWLAEPGGVAGIEPGPGEIIWSTILPPAVAAALLDAHPDE